MVTLETRVSQADPPPLFSKIEGEIVMLDVTSGNYYNLDPVGSDIWQRLLQPVTVTELCAMLEKDYDAESETIRREVLSLLEVMLEKGLITADD
jgi:hypothetical protein